jgi:hypothetical protein
LVLDVAFPNDGRIGGMKEAQMLSESSKQPHYPHGSEPIPSEVFDHVVEAKPIKAKDDVVDYGVVGVRDA